MSVEQLKKELQENNKSGSKTRELYIMKHFPDDYAKINGISAVSLWAEKLFWYINGLTEIPQCKKSDCHNSVKFRGYSKGYYQYCSIHCRNTDPNLIDNVKQKNIKNWGVDNVMKINEIKVKAKETKKIRYGNENFVNPNKAKETRMVRYGNKNFNNREKAILTIRGKFDADNYANRKQAKLTTVQKYGTENYSQTKEFVDRVRMAYNQKTNDEIGRINSKRKKTMADRYGVEHFSQSKISKERQIVKQVLNKSRKLSINQEQIQYNIENQMFTISGWCSKHDSFEIGYHVLKNRLWYGLDNICTKCYPVQKHESISENEILKFITDELNIEAKKIKVDGKEIDIYIEKNRLGIEYDGLYWHSNQYVDKDHHLNKTTICEKNGIHLIHVFENEWKVKKAIVKSIIKSKLGIFDVKLFARKCRIEVIESNQMVRDFLETNHLQGFVGSSIKIGLFYGEELVSLMTFGKGRISTGNKKNGDGEYEMLRFCNRLNTQVIGGASRMLKYFIENYNPKQILSFADRRYSNGKLYKKLGFEHVGNTEPNYWYFKPHDYTLYHRFRFRKNILVQMGYDPSKTEYEIMQERGYFRIYDSGSMKFVLKLQ